MIIIELYIRKNESAAMKISKVRKESIPIVADFLPNDLFVFHSITQFLNVIQDWYVFYETFVSAIIGIFFTYFSHFTFFVGSGDRDQLCRRLVFLIEAMPLPQPPRPSRCSQPPPRKSGHWAVNWFIIKYKCDNINKVSQNLPE